jgi:hypothetical protein
MPISGQRTHLCPSTELTLGGSKAAKLGSAVAVQRQRWHLSGGPSSQGFHVGLGPARGRPWGPRHLSARAQGSLPWST